MIFILFFVTNFIDGTQICEFDKGKEVLFFLNLDYIGPVKYTCIKNLNKGTQFEILDIGMQDDYLREDFVKIFFENRETRKFMDDLLLKCRLGIILISIYVYQSIRQT